MPDICAAEVTKVRAVYVRDATADAGAAAVATNVTDMTTAVTTTTTVTTTATTVRLRRGHSDSDTRHRSKYDACSKDPASLSGHDYGP